MYQHGCCETAVLPGSALARNRAVRVRCAMQRDDALRLLRERREQLNALGVGQLFLYGSVARNEALEDSDVDLLVEPSNQTFSIFDLVRLRDMCCAILGTIADIHDYDGLRRLPEFRRRIGSDLVRVF
jgi:uncharacterized protein